MSENRVRAWGVGAAPPKLQSQRNTATRRDTAPKQGGGRKEMLSAFSPLPSAMVNFMYQLDWATVCPTYLIKHYSRCFLLGYFWMRLTFKSVDWADYSPYVGEPHPVSRSLTRTKELTLPEERKNPSHLTAFELELFFLAFGLNWKHWLFLGLKPAGPQTGSTPSALLCLWLAKSSCRSWYLEVP